MQIVQNEGRCLWFIYFWILSDTVVFFSLSAVGVLAIMRYINLHITYLCVNGSGSVLCIDYGLLLSVHQLVSHAQSRRWTNNSLDNSFIVISLLKAQTTTNTFTNCFDSILCSEKKHPLTFSVISPCVMSRFKQKLQWIYLRNGRFWQCRN